ncbi:hypothetical protein CSA57_06135 [candidate division KSB3 bacterium]|nr:MAG: hypothetical protein CSA57_06135 [candidate division KSB3 bacterium]
MNYLKKLFSRGRKVCQDETADAVFIYTRCDTCRETFRNRIDKRYDLVMSYEDNGPAYRVRKELIGARCRNRISLNLDFDSQKRLIAKSAENGSLITREEFEQNAQKDNSRTDE